MPSVPLRIRRPVSSRTRQSRKPGKACVAGPGWRREGSPPPPPPDSAYISMAVGGLQSPPGHGRAKGWFHSGAAAGPTAGAASPNHITPYIVTCEGADMTGAKSTMAIGATEKT
ncbi:hypothetical protein GGTG_12863 [Gaeumannomyces tritici R3-111a-1]|uniref:Uncharacterized protein n=1 Tax=Gaeumannomyces tritici (strain R3-111a-1) TaxID=644352 RepID=J3PH83_GAET3|nr:hypothetical protein GGTG_12863 [Gaeumannomyces tritici R3-111a-1]EJT69243.1 hypothetical protein GGTG_12863 [Gaeumannomyces tritici R3-111a-1]